MDCRAQTDLLPVHSLGVPSYEDGVSIHASNGTPYTSWTNDSSLHDGKTREDLILQADLHVGV
jgi:hypothetical protein